MIFDHRDAGNFFEAPSVDHTTYFIRSSRFHEIAKSYNISRDCKKITIFHEIAKITIFHEIAREFIGKQG